MSQLLIKSAEKPIVGKKPIIISLSQWLGQTIAGTGILALIWTVGDPFGQECSLD